jgi:hypothetical protein
MVPGFFINILAFNILLTITLLHYAVVFSYQNIANQPLLSLPQIIGFWYGWHAESANGVG